MDKNSPYSQMLAVLASASILALATFLYSLAVIGARPMGFFFALGTALFTFGITVFGGVVLYLE